MAVIQSLRSSTAWRLVKERLPYGVMWRPSELDHALAAMGRGVGFVQIGSNDGITGDPIHRFVRWRGWRGAVVEPSPVPFGRLKRNYRDNRRVVSINAAVAAERGQADFFFLEPRQGDVLWADQIGSFSREHVLGHADHIPDIAGRVEKASVPVVTFDDVCSAAGLAQVDLVHMDVEGFDVQLLHLLPYDGYQIGAVLYEHAHMSDDEQREVQELLSANGFTRTASNHMDTLWRR